MSHLASVHSLRTASLVPYHTPIGLTKLRLLADISLSRLASRAFQASQPAVCSFIKASVLASAASGPLSVEAPGSATLAFDGFLAAFDAAEVAGLTSPETVSACDVFGPLAPSFLSASFLGSSFLVSALGSSFFASAFSPMID